MFKKGKSITLQIGIRWYKVFIIRTNVTICKIKLIHHFFYFLACIINACCVLHNIAVKRGLQPQEIHFDDIDEDLPIPDNDYNANNAEEVRRNIVRWHFQQ